MNTSISLRAADKPDLPAINGVIERAIMTWRLPDRVKRLSLALYRYNEMDLGHLEVCVAEVSGQISALAAWEPAEASDVPEGCRGLLLHGLYVDPVHQRQGMGAQLLAACVTRARNLGLDGVLVKAQADAEAFFRDQGLERLEVRDESRDYALRYWQRA